MGNRRAFLAAGALVSLVLVVTGILLLTVYRAQSKHDFKEAECICHDNDFFRTLCPQQGHKGETGENSWRPSAPSFEKGEWGRYRPPSKDIHHRACSQCQFLLDVIDSQTGRVALPGFVFERSVAPGRENETAPAGCREGCGAEGEGGGDGSGEGPPAKWKCWYRPPGVGRVSALVPNTNGMVSFDVVRMIGFSWSVTLGAISIALGGLLLAGVLCQAFARGDQGDTGSVREKQASREMEGEFSDFRKCPERIAKGQGMDRMFETLGLSPDHSEYESSEEGYTEGNGGEGPAVSVPSRHRLELPTGAGRSRSLTPLRGLTPPPECGLPPSSTYSFEPIIGSP